MKTKPYILAIDSSTSVLKVGLSLDNGAVKSLSSSDRYRHAEFIFKLIEQLLNDNKVAKSQLTSIVVSTGPGSFTGLRVGLASAKGIASSLKLPITGISNYSACAGSIYKSFGKSIVLIPSRRNEFYCATIDSEQFNDNKITVVKTEEIKALSGDQSVIGIDFDRINFDQSQFPSFHRYEPKIDDFINSGIESLNSGVDNIKTLEPLYIQNFQIKTRK
jgi:tRNA threonylcarbamoyladenosine biosynthesis protein TsaB